MTLVEQRVQRRITIRMRPQGRKPWSEAFPREDDAFQTIPEVAVPKTESCHRRPSLQHARHGRERNDHEADRFRRSELRRRGASYPRADRRTGNHLSIK